MPLAPSSRKLITSLRVRRQSEIEHGMLPSVGSARHVDPGAPKSPAEACVHEYKYPPSCTLHSRSKANARSLSSTGTGSPHHSDSVYYWFGGPAWLQSPFSILSPYFRHTDFSVKHERGAGISFRHDGTMLLVNRQQAAGCL
ncbi:hypothetical protein BKA81DRAFT_357407 [Phyllosticta paracitricarpa]